MRMEDWLLKNNPKFLNYLQYNGFHCARHKLFYLATPKAACTSLKWWFAELEGLATAIAQFQHSREIDPDLVIHDAFAEIAPSVNGLPIEQLMTPLTSPKYFRFAVVRNPYKRIFSAWQSKLLLREPSQCKPYLQEAFYNLPIRNAGDIAAAFEGFLEYLHATEAADFGNMHWTPQVDLLKPDLIDYAMIARIEQPEQLAGALEARLGNNFVDPFARKFANESLIPLRPEFISRRSAALIEEMYAGDFDAFHYSRQLPENHKPFSDEQLEVALKAVEMLRGRHQRVGEMRATLINLEHTLNRQIFSAYTLHRASRFLNRALHPHNHS